MHKLLEGDTMLTSKNNVTTIRQNIMERVAKSFEETNLEDINSVLNELCEEFNYYKNKKIQKASIKGQILASLGFLYQHIDASKNLNEFAYLALNRLSPTRAGLSVIKDACNACRSKTYEVTSHCQACTARPCQINCPKNAINVTKKASIDQDLCIQCGICATNCPYGAIHKSVVPCEDSCPVNAITKDSNGCEEIDIEKCISCGKCFHSCPFGAIVYNSQMIDVLVHLKNPNQKVVALVAPAVLGQFGNDLSKAISGLKALGFDDVIDVAYGADYTSKYESEEFVERIKEGAPFMTTSCCPAYVKAAKVHIPEIEKFISHTGSPMYYTALVAKERHPDAKIVFVGPCLAKRIEIENNPNIDYALVFADIDAMLKAKNIDINSLEGASYSDEASLQSRRYAISGGVANAVENLVSTKGDVAYIPYAINGLNIENIKALKRFALKGLDNGANMLEVMCCEGGCIGGPGCITQAKKASIILEKYASTGKNQKELDIK